MAEYYLQANTIFPYGKWTIAGANSDGIVYCASIDERILQVKLWSYNNFRRSWRVLAVSDLPSLPRLVERHYYLASAIYDERLERVDVFLECSTSSYVLRFITAPEPKFHSIFSAVNDANIEFDGLTGPSLHYCCGRLIITGSKRDDDEQVFRIFQVLINEQEHTFQLVQGWNSDRSHVYCTNRVVACGNRLLVLANGLEANGLGVFCFTPTTSEEILRWPNPTLLRHQLDSKKGIYDARFTSCPSVNSADVIWMISQSEGIQEATVTPDGTLATSRILERKLPNENTLYSVTSMTKSAAASTSHVFWLKYRGTGIVSKPFNVPSLECLCLSKLYETMEELKRCESEKDAIRMGIPITTWRRYCR